MKTNNYPNWLVPLEIAKELKEIGFDEPCTFFWDSSEDSNKLRCYLDENPEEEDVYLPASFNYNAPNTSGYYVYTSIPTWEQAFEWFREKGLFHNISMGRNSIEKNIDFESYVCKEDARIVAFLKQQYTYEEAREGLLNKLIEIYGKNK